MKKKAIITYLLFAALLLSSCVYRIPYDTQVNSAPTTQGTESAPSSSDTSPSFESIEYSVPTGSVGTPVIGDYCTVGPYTFQYSSYGYSDSQVYGWALMSCDDSIEVAVIPSEVMGIPVIGIGRWNDSYAPFGENNSLKSIVIPDSVLYICIYPFRFCDSLTDIKLSCHVKILGDAGIWSDFTTSLLKGTAVTFLDVPEGVEKLCEYVFTETHLQSIVLPSTLDIIEDCIFDNSPLKEVFFRGTEEQCLQTLKDQVAETEATLYFYSETEPTEEGNFWHYVDGKPVIW